MAGALIRNTKASPYDFSTAFIFNFFISLLLFVSVYSFAGKISSFYNDEKLEKLLKIASFIFVINAFQVSKLAKLISEGNFKRISIYRTVSAIIGSLCGLIAAYLSFAAVSLILIQLVNALCLSICLWIFHFDGFIISFKKESFKKLYSFGINTTLASILNTAFENIYQIILGKYFSVFQVGLFYQAKRLQEIPGSLLNVVTQNVIFSNLSKIQSDNFGFNNAFNKIFAIFSISLVYLFSLIYFNAENLIKILFGIKWVESTSFLKLLCIASLFSQLELVNRIIFKIYNKTNQILILEIIKKIIQIISIYIGLYFKSINYLIIGFVISSMLSFILNQIFSRKIIQLQPFTNLKPLFLAILFSIFFSFIDNIFPFVNLSTLTQIIYHTLLYSILFITFFHLCKIINVFGLLTYIKNIQNVK